MNRKCFFRKNFDGFFGSTVWCCAGSVFYKVLSAAASENMPKTQRTHTERRFLQNSAEKIPFDS